MRVQFNKQIMRRGKIIATGTPIEIDESELKAMQAAGAVVVKEQVSDEEKAAAADKAADKEKEEKAAAADKAADKEKQSKSGK